MQQLLAKYGKITDLLEEEAETFRSLASTKREFEAGEVLVASELQSPDQLYIVDDGRLFASMELRNGERAITRLYFPGDIMGTANIPFDHATQTITANTASSMYIFPRSNLVDAFTRLPRIAAIFYTFAALENAILNDRLVSIGRTRGRARLASLLLEIAAREHLVECDDPNICRPALTQEQIGDAIGLTTVQVSRLFKELTTQKLIKRRDGNVELLDPTALQDLGLFRNRYEDLDLDWFEEDF
ncbi:Crp/Fnr family transcriptional regulator [Erythrobacter crassostreae]|uniref:Crp/Fnr family transcriptional regulator n=1 Tax=Erythrobacter crassostreae TaxID=2828328 RepID=A0A9X1F1F2_9SPHN|nr:Crp/Fnr family transcriptional regulator [Erythrobacter crassostrea]MBV7258374.1 Crp/Fnr family transcriptional regulator [Erythrobacter crassostrea]